MTKRGLIYVNYHKYVSRVFKHGVLIYEKVIRSVKSLKQILNKCCERCCINVLSFWKVPYIQLYYYIQQDRKFLKPYNDHLKVLKILNLLMIETFKI